MITYNLGPDTPYDLDKIDKSKTLWIVIWYENNWYDGNGEAVWCESEDKLFCINLSHCSCYGPMDDAKHAKPMTSTQLLAEFDSEDVTTREHIDCVVSKVKELLKEV